MNKSKLGENWQAVGGLSLLLVVILRVLWQLNPGLLFCVLFWTASMPLGILWIIDNEFIWSKAARAVAKCGGLLNAVVTVANGGYMPVLSGETRSIWVSSTESHKLIYLADIYSGFSIGDFLIGAGLILVLGGWIWRRYRH